MNTDHKAIVAPPRRQIDYAGMYRLRKARGYKYTPRSQDVARRIQECKNRYNKRRREKNKSLGLTAQGKVRQIKPPRPELLHLHGYARFLLRQRLYRAEKRMTPIERAWREFRATINIKPPQFLTPFERYDID